MFIVIDLFIRYISISNPLSSLNSGRQRRRARWMFNLISSHFGLQVQRALTLQRGPKKALKCVQKSSLIISLFSAHPKTQIACRTSCYSLTTHPDVLAALWRFWLASPSLFWSSLWKALILSQINGVGSLAGHHHPCLPTSRYIQVDKTNHKQICFRNICISHY